MTRRFANLGREAVKRLLRGERASENGVTAERLSDGDIRW